MNKNDALNILLHTLHLTDCKRCVYNKKIIYDYDEKKLRGGCQYICYQALEKLYEGGGTE